MGKPVSGEILIVCTANICRSPMGAALLRHAIAAQPEPVRSIAVRSAGVAARGGEPITPHAIAALKKAGIDPSGHVSQPMTQDLLDRALAVFCMTESHRAMIRRVARPAPKRLFLFREFLPESAEREIADPFGGPLAAYEASRDEMVEAIPGIIAFLKKELS